MTFVGGQIVAMDLGTLNMTAPTSAANPTITWRSKIRSRNSKKTSFQDRKDPRIPLIGEDITQQNDRTFNAPIVARISNSFIEGYRMADFKSKSVPNSSFPGTNTEAYLGPASTRNTVFILTGFYGSGWAFFFDQEIRT